MDYSLKDLEKWNIKIEETVNNFGLDYYPQEFEIIGYNEMIAYETYVGMPSRYPHWSYGKSYEKTKTLYSVNLEGLPYELVINSNPCLAYLMKDNSLLLQILTMAHVYGHNDFFKNNRLFKEGTKASNTLEMFKLDAEIIRGYINNPNIGYEKVEKILDAAHALKFQVSRVIGIKELSQEKIKENLMKEYNNKIERRDVFSENKDIDMPDLNKIPLEPYDDVIDFIIKYGTLEEWEKTVLKIIKRETEYFIPQIETKIMNEGWASYWHYKILNRLKLDENNHLEFLKRHNDVVAPIVGNINPYYIGFKIFQDIEKRYGIDKIFEVRALERDNSFLRKYLTEDICRELNLFQYAKNNFEFIVEEVSDEEGWREIRDNLAKTSGMGSIPYIRVIDLDLKEGILTLEHVHDGRELDLIYAKETLKYVFDLWGKTVVLKTKTRDSRELNIICDNDRKVIVT